jgi:phage I-like protein
MSKSLLPLTSNADAEGLALQPFLPAGSVRGVDCRDHEFAFVNDRETTERLAAEFAQTVAAPGRDPLLGRADYEHHSFDPQNADTRSSGKIVGYQWVEDLPMPGGEKFSGTAARIKWTPAARAAIEGGEYEGFSPVFGHDADGRLLQFFGGALTNDPAFREIKAVAAKSGERRERLAVLAAGRQGPDGTSNDLPAQESTTMDLMQELRKRLGLDDTADAEKLLAAVDDLVAKIGEAAEDQPVEGETVMARAGRIAGSLVQARAARDAERGELAQLRAARDTLTTQVGTVTGERDTARAECKAARDSLADREAEIELDKFADRIPPAERAQCKSQFLADRAAFATAMAARPANLIPLKGQGTADAGGEGAGENTASGLRKRVIARGRELRERQPTLSVGDAEMAALRELTSGGEAK